MLPEPIFPPRPKGRLLWTHLPRYERQQQWVVQLKFNGKYVVVWVDTQTQEVGIWGRETEPLKRFRPGQWLFDQFLSLNLEGGKQYWLAGELLHQKTTDPHYQNRIVLFDVIQAGHKVFVGPSAPDQMARLSLLSNICRQPTQLEPKRGIALVVTDNIWLAETFPDRFPHHFQRFAGVDEIEGLMLKKRAGKLREIGDEYWETTDWIRVRREKTSYTH